MDYALTDEQRLIQQTAREFAQEFIGPAAAEIDKTGIHPVAIIRKMVEYDFLGLYLPGEYGGAEAGYLSYVLTVEELAKVSGAVAAILVQHASAAAYAVCRWGCDWQKKTFLTAMAKGEKLGAAVVAGTAAEQVTATRDGGSYILNGKKLYVANGGVADLYIVFAVTDPAAGSRGVSAFIVKAATGGLTIGRQIDKMGLRGCQWAELVFDSVKIPVENLLGEEGAGNTILAEVQAVTGIAEGAVVLGIAQAAMQDAAQYAKERIQFGRPIAVFPAIQSMLAEMAVNIHLTRLAVYHAADLVDKGVACRLEAAMIRQAAARFGPGALIDAVQVEGGYGYSDDMPVTRLFRDMKGVILKNNSAEFPEKIIAAEVLV